MFNLSEKATGYIIVSSGSLLMCLDPMFIRLSGTSEWNTSFLFGIFTFISMSLVTHFFFGGIRNSLRGNLFPMILSGLLMGGSGTCIVLSVKNTYVANTMMIMSTGPLTAAILSLIFIGEKTPLRNWIAAFTAVGGIYLIARDSMGSGNLFGDMMALLGNFFVSSLYVLWRKYKKISRTMVIALGGLAIASFSFFMADFSTISGYSVMVMLVMGLITAPVGRVLLSLSARYILATEVSLFAIPRSIAAILIIWIVFGEIPPEGTFIGGGIILTALIAVTYLNLRKESASGAK